MGDGTAGAGWVVVVPVKAADAGKSRLAGRLPAGDHARLVRAMALDTLAAAAEADGVVGLVVVTPDPVLPGELAQLTAAPVVRLPEPVPPHGAGPAPDAVEPTLDAAVGAGVAHARRTWPGAGVAVLLGDLPGLRPADLTDALRAAGAHDRALVTDAEGTGTTLLTVAAGAVLRTRFGRGSAAAHVALGHAVLDVPAGSSLRHDVDTWEDLTDQGARPGPRTRAALADAPLSR